METYIVYKLTRNDGQVYIGTTYRNGFNRRMTAHSKTKRFQGYIFTSDILLESDDYNYIMQMEEEYITIYDSYKNGLNESIDGKGNHMAPNFTTKDYKFSDESRKKMSKSAKKRIERDGPPRCKHTEEQKKKWSKMRKGVRNTHKLTKEQVIEILTLYRDKPDIEGVGKVMRNGVKMSYAQAFAAKYCEQYSVSKQCLRLIIDRKTWKDVEIK